MRDTSPSIPRPVIVGITTFLASLLVIFLVFQGPMAESAEATERLNETIKMQARLAEQAADRHDLLYATLGPKFREAEKSYNEALKRSKESTDQQVRIIRDRGETDAARFNYRGAWNPNDIMEVEREANRPSREAALSDAAAGKITKSEALRRMSKTPDARRLILEDFKARLIGKETALAALRGEKKYIRSDSTPEAIRDYFDDSIPPKMP